MSVPVIPAIRTVQPGDILCVRTNGWAGRLIRFGAALRGQPDMDNHVAIAHHFDAAGRLWCLEGRPGGVGWRDARDYLASPWTVNNALQAKTAAQRETVAGLAAKMIGTAYDWAAIADDAFQALRLPAIWRDDWGGKAPGHVVCSSFAAYLYGKAGLGHPDLTSLAYTTPADWQQFIITSGYNVPLRG